MHPRRRKSRYWILAVFIGLWIFMKALDRAAPVPVRPDAPRSGFGPAPSGAESQAGPAADIVLAERSTGAAPEEESAPELPAGEPSVSEPRVPEFVAVRVTGMVKAGEDLEPVPDARVRAYTQEGGDSAGSRERTDLLVEASTRTTEEGLYEIELAVARPWARDGKIWIGLEVESGAGRSLDELSADVAVHPVELRFDAWLEPGGTFSGRILAADGQVAQGAEVYLYGAFDEDGQNGWNEVDSGRTLPDGRFVLRVHREGSYSLRARADGRGATLRDLGLVRELGATEIGDVYLSGGGLLAGTVQDPAGNGVPGLLVRAIHSNLEPDWEAARTAATRFSEGSLGQLYAETQTGPRGEFRLAGLAPGEFWILCESDGVPLIEGLDQGPHAVGRRDLQLVVAEYRLTLEVGLRPGGVRPRGRAYCAELAPILDGWETLGEVQWLAVYESPRAAFRVLPGHRYAVGIASSSLPPLERILVVDADDFRPRVTLDPGRAERFGSVRIWVDTPRGDLLHTALVQIVAPESGVVLQEFPAPIGSEGYVLDLAPGRYRILAGPRDRTEAGRPLLPGRAEVTVESQRSMDLELHARAGGELRLTLEVPGEITDPELAAVYEVIRETGERPSQSVRTRHGAKVRLESADGGRARVVEFVFPDGLSPYPATALLPGETASVSTVLEPGAYVLDVEVPGFTPVRRLVEVDADDPTDVTLKLE